MHMIPQLCRLSLAGTLCVGCIAKITLLGTSVQHCTTSLAAQVMEASPESRQLHEQLESLQEQCSCWSLDADRQLLSALQNMSSGLLASLQRCRGEVESVAREAEAAAVSVAAATSHFRLLSHRRFIQQVCRLFPVAACMQRGLVVIAQLTCSSVTYAEHSERAQ